MEGLGDIEANTLIVQFGERLRRDLAGTGSEGRAEGDGPGSAIWVLVLAGEWHHQPIWFASEMTKHQTPGNQQGMALANKTEQRPEASAVNKGSKQGLQHPHSWPRRDIADRMGVTGKLYCTVRRDFKVQVPSHPTKVSSGLQAVEVTTCRLPNAGYHDYYLKKSIHCGLSEFHLSSVSNMKTTMHLPQIILIPFW